MQKLKNSFLLLLSIFSLSINTLNAQGVVLDEIIAVVGADPILKSEVENQFLRMQAQGYKVESDSKCKILEEMMLQKLLLDQAKIDSIEVPENSVMAQVDDRINDYIAKIGSREKMEEYFNKKTHELKEEMRDIIRDQMLTGQMQQKLTENISTTPAQVRLFHRQMPQDSIPEIPAQMEIQQIAIYPQLSQKEVDDIKNRLREYQERVKKGEDFSMLAVLYSQDEGSATRGGELGFVGKGSLVPEFAEVAFNLRDPKLVSRIVKTEFGYHIIQLIERRGNRINCRHILIKPEASDSAKTLAISRLDSIASLLRENKASFEEAALHFSMDVDTRNNGGTLNNPETSSTKFLITQLNPSIAKAVQNMELNEISKPILIRDSKEREMYVILKLKSKIPAHKANAKDDYQYLKSMLEAKKRQEKIETWIKEKQASTYITIDPKWRDCVFNNGNWIK